MWSHRGASGCDRRKVTFSSQLRSVPAPRTTYAEHCLSVENVVSGLASPDLASGAIPWDCDLRSDLQTVTGSAPGQSTAAVQAKNQAGALNLPHLMARDWRYWHSAS